LKRAVRKTEGRGLLPNWDKKKGRPSTEKAGGLAHWKREFRREEGDWDIVPLGTARGACD